MKPVEACIARLDLSNGTTLNPPAVDVLDASVDEIPPAKIGANGGREVEGLQTVYDEGRGYSDCTSMLLSRSLIHFINSYSSSCRCSRDIGDHISLRPSWWRLWGKTMIDRRSCTVDHERPSDSPSHPS